MYIESDKNPKIKNILKLIEKSRERRVQNKFVVEGKQENFFAIEGGYQPTDFFVQPDIFTEPFKLPKEARLYEVSQSVYEKIAYRKITEGIVGIYNYKEESLSSLPLSENPFLVIVESIEKPGNLGAICRSADAFGADAVIVCEERTDIYNPNVIRSSVGSFFNLSVLSSTNEEVYNFLKERAISAYATYMDKKSINIQEADFKEPTALIFGTESSGISNFWEDKIKCNIIIPMKGKIDSLNVSNAVSIACYEVERQRIILNKE